MLPRLVVIACALDLALRTLPVTWLTYRPDEALRARPARGGGFAANRVSRYPHGYGDLAALANLPHRREYRLLRFTTDDLGFRNASARGEFGAVLFGDSFAYGSGLDDADTLSTRLGAALGCDVYNAAGAGALRAPEIIAVTRRIGLRGGVVIMERVERELRTVPAEADAAAVVAGAFMAEGASLNVRLARVGRRTSVLLARGAARLRRETELATALSPVRIFSTRLHKAVENDRLLPNSYAGNAVTGTLRNGDWMLFYPEELQADTKESPPATAYWTSLARDLRNQGLELVVLLVPDKHTVYHELLRTPLAPSARPGERMDRLERALRAEGVSVVNLRPAFTAAAPPLLTRGEYLYWRDDTHWNPRGVRLAAEEIARVVGGEARGSLRGRPPCGSSTADGRGRRRRRRGGRAAGASSAVPAPVPARARSER
jgi:SGNH hydrolase-like domain, acetyltransferase AlgX